MLTLKSISCRQCHDLLQDCFTALVNTATPLSQPMIWPSAESMALIFHGGQYSSDDYAIIAAQLKTAPRLLIYLSARDGTFAPLWKKSDLPTESAWHEQQLRRRGVTQTIMVEPSATNTAEEIQAAARRPEVTQVKKRYALVTDLHALRVTLTYRQAPTLQPHFLRPGVIHYHYQNQQWRLLQEVYRVLLYTEGETIQKPSTQIIQLFQEIVLHQYNDHSASHAKLLADCALYIKKYFGIKNPFLFCHSR